MEEPQYNDSKEKLIRIMKSTIGSGDRIFETAKVILEVKGQEEIAEETKSLKSATWGLFAATAAMVIATFVLVYVTYTQS